MGVLFTDTVTLYHRTRSGREDVWTRCVLRGVQWRQKAVRSAADGKIVYATETSVTIPIEAAPDGLAVCPEDLLVPGECEAEISASLTEDDILREYGGVTVKSVADNTLRPRLRNRKVTAV